MRTRIDLWKEIKDEMNNIPSTEKSMNKIAACMSCNCCGYEICKSCIDNKINNN